MECVVLSHFQAGSACLFCRLNGAFPPAKSIDAPSQARAVEELTDFADFLAKFTILDSFCANINSISGFLAESFVTFIPLEVRVYKNLTDLPVLRCMTAARDGPGRSQVG